MRALAAQNSDLYEALRSDNPPEEVLDLVRLLSALLRPRQREKIRSPTDVAAMVMVKMRRNSAAIIVVQNHPSGEPEAAVRASGRFLWRGVRGRLGPETRFYSGLQNS